MNTLGNFSKCFAYRKILVRNFLAYLESTLQIFFFSLATRVFLFSLLLKWRNLYLHYKVVFKMNYHSLSLWANPHNIVIEPQPKDCPETFVMTNDEIFISYLNIPTLQVIIHNIMNKLNPPTKWLVIKHMYKNSQMSPCHPMDLLTTWKSSFDSPLAIMDWWSKDTMVIKCQHNIWNWWKKIHLNEMI